jgi:hypothetical protein
VGAGQPSCCLENNTFNYFGGTGSELKLTLLREKLMTKELNSTSQACPAGERSWQLFIYQLLWDHFRTRTYKNKMTQGAHHPRRTWAKTP